MNAQNKQYNTALHLACYSGKIEITQMLLDHGANMNEQNEQGETPLHLVSRGQYDSEEHGVGIARLLLARGVDVNAQDKDQFTPFLLAAFNGRLEIAQVLLDHGANTNAQNDQGETPLHLVSRGKYDSEEYGVGIARLLLARGVDANAQDKDHDTPLHWAAFYGRSEITRLLLDHGAKVNTENGSGETPLHLVSRGEYDSQQDGVSIARLVLACGVDANAQDKDHDTPLLWAAFYGRLEITRLLLDHGAKANTEDDSGETPLHLVSRGIPHYILPPTLGGPRSHGYCSTMVQKPAQRTTEHRHLCI